MKPPIKPSDEISRLESLKKLQILDTPLSPHFEKITRIAQALFKVPIVAISLIDDERQWFKSIIGIDVCETSREVSFCGHTILQDDIFIVNDTFEDDKFTDNPLVLHDPNIRFYAGSPVRSAAGYRIGTLCLIDTEPHDFKKEELLPLKDLAELAEEELQTYKQSYCQSKLLEELNEVKKNSYIDSLTRIWNRGAIESILVKQLALCKSNNESFGLLLFDIDDFKNVNDNYGHNVGDYVLQQTAKLALTCLRECDAFGRWGGEEYLIILASQQDEILKSIADRIRTKIQDETIMLDNINLNYTISMGVMMVTPSDKLETKHVIKKVDVALYKAKNAGKNRIVLVENIGDDNDLAPSKS
jgi:diguanylate cyclase (GGDEF)-like protein